jgi:hypothetical protein
MLSNEQTQAQVQASRERLIEEAQARGQASALAQALVRHEHNPDPHPERNLPNPATAGVVIRKWHPTRTTLDYRAELTKEVKDHNSAVSELRKP